MRYKCFGIEKYVADTPQTITNTEDGLLYATHRSSYPEAEDEKLIHYKAFAPTSYNFTLSL
jgi:hypothetical protein